MLTAGLALAEPSASLSLCPLSRQRDRPLLSSACRDKPGPALVWPLAAQGTSGDQRLPAGKADASMGLSAAAGTSLATWPPGWQGSGQLLCSVESWVYGEPEPQKRPGMRSWQPRNRKMCLPGLHSFPGAQLPGSCFHP